MRLCEVRGCRGTAVGLVSVKAPSWRVAESRRVCANHHRELTPQETTVEKKKTKVGQVGPCQDCKAQKRIKARNRCETCYQKHRKTEKAKEATAATPAQEFPTRVQYLEMDSRKYSESLAILRALVMELDEWHTEDMVDHMGVPELVTALQRHHQATVDRWKAKADRLEEEVTRAQKGAGNRMMVGAAATLAARAADELEPWASERDAVVGMMLRSVVDTLEAVNG